MIIGLVVLVAAGATGAGWLFLIDDDEGQDPESNERAEPQPQQLSGEMGWQLEPGGGDAPSQLGAWVTDDVAVAATEIGLIGYDRENGPDSDGEPVWGLQPPELDGWPTATEDPAVCGASTTAHNGVVAITYGASVPEEEQDIEDPSGPMQVCPGLALVDLETGEPVWTTDMYPEEDGTLGAATDPHPEIAGESVAVTFSSDFRAFDREDGSDKWRAYARDAEREYCSAEDLQVHNGQFVAVANCYDSFAEREDPEPLKVLRIDPDSGDDERTGVSVEGIGVAPGLVSIVSPRSPVVLHVSPDDPDEQERYLVVGQGDEPPVKVLAEREGLDTRTVGSIGSRNEYRTLVTDDLLITATSVAARGGGAQPNELVAYELASGEQAWQATPPDGMDQLYPVAAQDGRVIAVGTHEGDKMEAPVAVYEVNPADGSLETLADGYDGHGIKLAVSDSTFVWHLGRIYVFSHFGASGLPEIYALH